MVYALISDIHSNAEALEAVVGDAQNEGVDGFLCLGDIVGYGAEPHVCLERIRGLKGVVVIAGNHDYAVCGKTDVSNFNTYARKAVQWTAQQLNIEDRTYLAGLPLSYRWKNFVLVHASLDHPECWTYILTEEDARKSFAYLNDDILFIGHSHVPVIFTDRHGDIRIHGAEDFKMERDTRYIVNIGSVGQPRDYDNRSSYCIFDDEEQFVRFRRVPYDIHSTQAKILHTELPKILAQRLEIGR